MIGPCVRGEVYVHKTKGRCVFISSHPDDGAELIMERWVNDTAELFSCEHSDIEPAPPKDAVLEPFSVSMHAALSQDSDGDFVLYCPRINDAVLAGYSEVQILTALGAN